jgi:hypothetical protein
MKACRTMARGYCGLSPRTGGKHLPDRRGPLNEQHLNSLTAGFAGKLLSWGVEVRSENSLQNNNLTGLFSAKLYRSGIFIPQVFRHTLS